LSDISIFDIGDVDCTLCIRDTRSGCIDETRESEQQMATAEIAIAIDERLLHDVDLWIASGEFPDRNVAVQAALTSLRDQRVKRRRMLRELSKLDQSEERLLADEHLASEVQWPPY